MRIIAGKYRSRVLLAPQTDRTTRPITDRVKQSLFDIIAPWIDGAAIYDCFAGTGSMGLECLSRGARHATFFEIDRSALDRLKKNITALNVSADSTIVAQDIFHHFASARPSAAIALIFLDPPYRYLREKPAELAKLATRMATHLTPDGLLIFRHDTSDSLPLPGLDLADTRTYGQMTLEFHKRPG